MRILFLTGTFWPVIGGIEVHATELLPALQEQGYEFIVMTTSRPGLPQEAKIKGIPVYRFPFWRGYNDVNQLMVIRQQIARLKRSFAPDLVHINGVGVVDFFHLITANVHPAPLLVTLCNDLRHQSVEHETSLGQIFCNADWVTSVSVAALNQVSALVPEIRSHSSVIHYGLETPLDAPTPLPTDAPRLLCIGRLAPQKGFDLALNAFSAIVNRFPHTRLVIAGDGPERSALERQTDRLGLTHAVDYIGWVLPEKVPELINTSTLVLMPSRWEGHPLVALQATLLARPIVATRVGGLPEIVEHQHTGLLVEKENSTALADAITFLLGNATTASRMGQEARRRTQQMFSWDGCVEAYGLLYQKLIRKGPRRSTTSKSPEISRAGRA